jgi:integrase
MVKLKALKDAETMKSKAEKIKNRILVETHQRDEITEFLDFIAFGYANKEGLSKRIIAAHKRNVERDLAIISLALESGLRAFELVELNVEDINLENNSIILVGKGSTEDVAYFTDAAKENIVAYLAIRKERYKIEDNFKPLFVSCGTGPKAKPDRLSKRALQNLVEKYATTFGKPYLTVHKLRHTFATRFHKKNNDVVKLQAAMRHRSVDTSMIYTHVTNEELKEAVNKIND